MTFIKFMINNEPAKRIVFPITEVGDSSIMTLQIFNPTDEAVELTPSKIEDSNVEIIQYPKVVESKQTGLVQLRFTVPEDRRKSLQTSMLFKEVLGRI